MKNPFKSNWTKWIPLGVSIFAEETQNVIFFRGNKKSGLLEFRAIKANPSSFWPWNISNPVLPQSVLDPTDQWNKMQEMISTI